MQGLDLLQEEDQGNLSNHNNHKDVFEFKDSTKAIHYI